MDAEYQHGQLDTLQQRFKHVNFLILVPKYNTLRQQTKERVEKLTSLLRTGQDAQDVVYLYGVGGALTSALDSMATSIQTNTDTLHVLVVDECHYAPTVDAIPILHDTHIRNQTNFLVLLISATPYNCLSSRSMIDKENIIHWNDIETTTNTFNQS